MKSLRTKLGISDTADSGISLIEIIIAILIFAIISVGVATALVSTLRFSADSRAREIAINIAAQEIDSARSTVDVFQLLSLDKPSYTVGTNSFHVHRETRWVSDPNSDAPCGAGGGALQYKRVNVTVTWAGMVQPDLPVRADTLVAAKTRISDPDQATILVSVVDSDNKGVSGVSIAVSPSLTPAPAATDAQGCSYLLKVPAGAYNLTVTKAGYIDTLQRSTPSVAFTVAAGTSYNAAFTMELAQPLTLKYGSNLIAPFLIPSNMDTSLLHATDAVINSAATTGAQSRIVPSLYPFGDGYTALAGKYVEANSGVTGCMSTNPANWPTGMIGAVNYTAPPALAAVTPASGATIGVPMASLQVLGTSGSKRAIIAVGLAAAVPGTADPGCTGLKTVGPPPVATVMSYTIPSAVDNKGLSQLALPYGSWQLYYDSVSTSNKVPNANITVAAPSSVTGTGIVTLDPRIVLP